MVFLHKINFMNKFYHLKVSQINRLTTDSVQISFQNSYPDIFKFKAGQYITLKMMINGNDVRRSYSLSSSPSSGLEIGVKLVKNGLMSTYLTQRLKVGDSVEVMPPLGNFILEHKSNSNHYVAFCAGSGITPILSMIKSVTENEPESLFTIVYGNKSRKSVMFANELDYFESNFQSQIFTHYVFSRDKVEGFLNGRIDANILSSLFESHPNLNNAHSYFICGPGKMIDNVNKFLIDIGCSESNIHFERFIADDLSVKNVVSHLNEDENPSNVMVSVDGDEFEFELASSGISILDAAIEQGADVPFSCKGGVCCVCKAKLISGEVTMDQNFSLSEDEVEDGFVLACQSHPASQNVELDFDVI